MRRVLVAGVLAGCFLAGHCTRVLCSDEIIARVRQPHGVLEATALVRNCGATTDYSTLVELRNVQSWAEPEDVLAVNGDARGVRISWVSNHDLVIRCPSCERRTIVRFVKMLGDVDIQLNQ
jgi:hypothetical protein